MNTSAFASSGGGGGSSQRRISSYHNHHHMHHIHRIARPTPPVHHFQAILAAAGGVPPLTGSPPSTPSSGKNRAKQPTKKIWLATSSLDCDNEDSNEMNNNGEHCNKQSNTAAQNNMDDDQDNNNVDDGQSKSATASIGAHQSHHQHIKFKTHPLQYISYRLLDLIHKAFEKEEKVDELEMMINEICGGQEFIYRRQQEIEVLCQKTSFSKQEIKLLYWGWKLACPEGVLNELIFKDIYGQFFPQAGDSSLYARLVFQAMFAETLAKNEPITFLEYAKALSTLCRGSMMDKIKWMFTLYDINHDGRITYDEVYRISVAIYALLGFHVTPMHNHRTYEEHAKKVFAKLDQQHLGYVTFEQFKEVCLKNETMIQSMQQLDTNSI